MLVIVYETLVFLVCIMVTVKNKQKTSTSKRRLNACQQLTA